MVTLFGMLELNKRSLFSTQYALQTVNHNISNVNNEGYSRQEVLFKTSMPTITPFGVLGNGVSVATIRRATAEFYTKQIRQENAAMGGWDSVSSTLSEIESVLGEPKETGLSDAINEFFSSWNDLAVDPESGALRVAVVESASRLSDTFQALDLNLEQVGDNLNTQLRSKVDEFNSLLSRVTNLNGQIVADEVRGVTAGDLRDERDRLLLDMSKIAKIDVKEDSYGAIDVYLGGVNIAHRTEAKLLDVHNDSQENSVHLVVVLKGERDALKLEDGELTGILDARDASLKEVQSKLDHIAKVIVDKVNELHRRGWTASGSGYDFFAGDDAASINIAYAIKQNPALVATSYDGTIGDNSLANDICALSSSVVSDSEPFTINELFESLISTVGTYSQNAKGMVKNEELILENLDLKKESITGVNMDEELVKMSQYQNSYEAAAKMTQMVQDLIQTIVNLPQGITT
jgi:flagellar hook-associated protein 1